MNEVATGYGTGAYGADGYGVAATPPPPTSVWGYVYARDGVTGITFRPDDMSVDLLHDALAPFHGWPARVDISTQ